MDGTAAATLLLAGDAMTGRGVDQALARHCAPQLYEPYLHDACEYLRLAEAASGPLGDPLAAHEPRGDALEAFVAAGVDARIVNLETALTTHDVP